MISLLIFSVVAIAIVYIVDYYDEKTEEKRECNKKKKSQIPKTEVKQSPSIVNITENPKVTAVKNAARQSVKLNLMAMESFRQMSEISRLAQTESAPRSHSQDSFEYRRMEWMQDDDNWRSDRF